MAKVMAILMGIIEVKEKCARVKVSDLVLRSKTFNSVEFLHGSQIGRDKMLLWPGSQMSPHLTPPTSYHLLHTHRSSHEQSFQLGAESCSRFLLGQKFFNYFFQRTSKILHKGLFRIAKSNDFIKKKEYSVIIL